MKDHAEIKNLLQTETNNILQIVKQRKMIYQNEDNFFNNFKLHTIDFEVNNNGNAGGIELSIIDPRWNDAALEELIEKYTNNQIIKESYYNKIFKAFQKNKRIHTEYKEFSHDTEIGDFIYPLSTPKIGVQCMAAHEIAHSLQQWNREPGYDDNAEHPSHNEIWKKYYRILRRELGLTK